MVFDNGPYFHFTMGNLWPVHAQYRINQSFMPFCGLFWLPDVIKSKKFISFYWRKYQFLKFIFRFIFVSIGLCRKVGKLKAILCAFADDVCVTSLNSRGLLRLWVQLMQKRYLHVMTMATKFSYRFIWYKSLIASGTC